MPQFKPDFGIEKPEKKTITLEMWEYYIVIGCSFALGCVITGVIYAN